MTRETKIGLLVGLAFIIVIGILLSDHLTSSTEPPPATLTQVGQSVRTAAATPAANVAPVTQVAAPTQVAPQNPVLTQNEVAPPAPPVQIIAIGPAAEQHSPLVTHTPVQMMQAAPVDPTPFALPEPPITRTPSVADPIAQAALQHGEQIVALESVHSAAPSASRTAWSEALNGMREYKAEDGDSLSKMASKFFGSNTKSNRDAIIKANPTLQQNPDLVVAGRTYLIPPTANIAGTITTPAPRPAAPTTSDGHWYTVKAGDNLTKIALEQLGTTAAVQAIKDLNKESLKGGDTIFVEMKLRLPAKPLASAN
jgi:nucleoid-associated protein YgaU